LRFKLRVRHADRRKYQTGLIKAGAVIIMSAESCEKYEFKAAKNKGAAKGRPFPLSRVI